MKTKVLSVRIPEPIVEEIKERSKKEGREISEIVREALYDGLAPVKSMDDVAEEIMKEVRPAVNEITEKYVRKLDNLLYKLKKLEAKM